MLEKREFYINGAWVKPLVPRDCLVIDPSTEEVCAVISVGGAEDVNRAVAAAKRAFETSEAVAGGVTLARDLINTPANDMGPDELAQAAQALAVKRLPRCTISSIQCTRSTSGPT